MEKSVICESAATGIRNDPSSATGELFSSVSRTVGQRADVSRADDAVGEIESRLAELQAQLDADVAEIQNATAPAIQTVDIKAKKADTAVVKVALLWRSMP